MATHAHFAIKSITEQEAVIRLSARLVDPVSASFINLPPMTLKVVGHDLDALVKKTVVAHKIH
jgi:hypothetical protein